jgi:hypothetical protein
MSLPYMNHTCIISKKKQMSQINFWGNMLETNIWFTTKLTDAIKK